MHRNDDNILEGQGLTSFFDIAEDLKDINLDDFSVGTLDDDIQTSELLSISDDELGTELYSISESMLRIQDEDLDLPNDVLEDIDTRDISTVVAEAVEYHILFKEAELNYTRSDKDMTSDYKTKKAFKALTTGKSNTDKAGILAFLSSVINYDNSSVFSDTSEYSIAMTKYKVMAGLAGRLRGLGLLEQEKFIQLSTLTQTLEQLFEEKKTVSGDSEKGKRLYNEFTQVREELESLIYENNHLSSYRVSIDSAIETISDLKSTMLADTNTPTRRSREEEAKLNSIRAELDLLKAIVAPIDEEAVEAGFTVNRPIATIFKSIKHPAIGPDKIPGFKYVCGQCGEEHFTTEKLIYVNRMDREKFSTNYRLKDNPPDYISTMMTIFKPMVCPSCASINLFSKTFTKSTKAYVIISAISNQAFLVDKKPGTSEINLSLLADALKNYELHTEIIGDTTTEDPEYLGYKPLDDQLDKYIGDFITMVEQLDSLSTVQQDTSKRMINYLKLLYKIKPVYHVAVDEISAMYTILDSDPETRQLIEQCCSIRNTLERRLFILSTIERLAKYTGSVIKNDLVLNKSFLQQIVQEYNNTYNLLIPDTMLESIPTIAYADVLKDSLTKELQEVTKSLDEIKSTIHNSISSYKSYKIGKIIRPQRSDILESSGIIAEMWKIYKNLYPLMLEDTVVPIILSNPSSTLFIRGSYTGSPDKDVKLYRSLCRKGHVVPDRSPNMQTQESSVKLILQMIGQISNPNAFEAVTGVPVAMLTDKKDNSEVITRESPLTLTEFTTLFGVDYDFEVLMKTGDMDLFIESISRSSNLDEEVIADSEQANILALQTAFLFAYCTPAFSNKEREVQNKVKNWFIEESRHEAARIKELGIH